MGHLQLDNVVDNIWKVINEHGENKTTVVPSIYVVFGLITKATTQQN